MLTRDVRETTIGTKLENENRVRIIVTVDEIMLDNFCLNSGSCLNDFAVSIISLVYWCGKLPHAVPKTCVHAPPPNDLSLPVQVWFHWDNNGGRCIIITTP